MSARKFVEFKEDNGRIKVLVMCAHLHEDRAVKRDMDYLQPMVGLHLASLFDPKRYQVRLYHEMWHGPYDTNKIPDTDILVLSGLHMDFDRMRQLSYLFKRKGALIVAGGSMCTMFPEFAADYFDTICVGGIESMQPFIKDFEAGEVKPRYDVPKGPVGSYQVNHALLRENGINIPVHYIEASRGCNFQCFFCIIPAERARHAPYNIEAIKANIDQSINSSPWWSIRRRYPMLWFIDNNFSNNLKQVRQLCEYFKSDKRIKLWGALITQDVLANREIMKLLAESKCRGVFAGIESFDVQFLQEHNKFQNKKNAGKVIDDIKYAESLGITVVYGYLFDPRISKVADMKSELKTILNSDILHFPYFLAYVTPLAGTGLFWDAAEKGELVPNMRLRDLEGRCVAYRNTLDPPDVLREFSRSIFATPSEYMRKGHLIKQFIKAIFTRLFVHPPSFLIFSENRLRLIRLGWKHAAVKDRTYLGGTEVLDPQYAEMPDDISAEDRQKYYDPIYVTDAQGDVTDWLKPYQPPRKKKAAEKADDESTPETLETAA